MVFEETVRVAGTVYKHDVVIFLASVAYAEGQVNSPYVIVFILARDQPFVETASVKGDFPLVHLVKRFITRGFAPVLAAMVATSVLWLQATHRDVIVAAVDAAPSTSGTGENAHCAEHGDNYHVLANNHVFVLFNFQACHKPEHFRRYRSLIFLSAIRASVER